MLVAALVIRLTAVLGLERMAASAVALDGKKIAADLQRSDETSTQDCYLDGG